MATVDASGLGVVYESATGRVTALDRVDLSLTDGEAVSIIGPSGCGKTTLLLAMAGLVPLSDGDLRIDGIEMSGPRLDTALILQDFGLLPWKRAFENAALGLTIRGVPRGEASRRTEAALEQVGMVEFARAYPGELSGGMRQRIALSRAIAVDADLLLMDEPLAALDALTRENLQDFLLDLWCAREHTQVVVTHSIEEAVYLGQRILVMSQRPGRIAHVVENPGIGTPDYRASQGFYSQCARLRALLEEEGVLHESGCVR